MERKLQQRLVGILVLAAFALLVAPVLLDGEGRIPEKITHIPPEPVRPDLSHIQTKPIVADVASGEAEPVEPELPVEQSAPEAETAGSNRVEPVVAAATVTPPSVQQAVSSSVGTQLWSVQVASFKDSAKAVALKDRLRSEGFNTYVREKLLSDDSLFTQVFVGPVETKQEADNLKAQVKAGVQLQGLVVRFRDR
ncbi:SPOR domain-containing protein [Reinekea marinisedimentorum]|uniref:DedD protein n=1 Tax=Reinekea marinisedimentorum TaxID=230495 RepID=A0A4R3I8V6_9GAMM|nr:SPOR domain-containing protein [Reinekea marinisedimentorum]TCS41446.1 DedD protein [Reinekea marinisedimentorum]